jgi:biopolymer transport protein ExbD
MAAKLGGLKGGKYTIGQNADINVTPFVDVMLVLLIIFMVSAPLATVAIKIDLPPSEAPPPGVHTKPVYISMKDDGNIYIVDQHTTLETLQPDLQRAFIADGVTTDPRKQTILIRADRLVRYGAFMSVVNQLQADGFFKVSLITENLT